MQILQAMLASWLLVLYLPSLTQAMAYRDNHIWFFNQADQSAERWTRGSFNVTQAIIPAGQDPLFYHNDTHNRVHPLLNTDDRWNSYFSFIVGRHGSKEVAHWWNTNITAGRNTFGHNAQRLNFVFLGDLKLETPIPEWNMTFPNIAIAQGHHGAENNWWLGGLNCGRVEGKDNAIMCPGTVDSGVGIKNATGISAYFHRGGGRIASVEFGPIQYNSPQTGGTGGGIGGAPIGKRDEAPVNINNISALSPPFWVGPKRSPKMPAVPRAAADIGRT